MYVCIIFDVMYLFLSPMLNILPFNFTTPIFKNYRSLYCSFVTAGAGGDDDIPRTQGCGQGRGGEQSGRVHGSRRWRPRAGHRPGGRPLQSTHCWRLRLLQHRLATPGSGDRQQGPRLREDSAVPCHRRRHCKLYTTLTSYRTQLLGYINNWLHRLR